MASHSRTTNFRTLFPSLSRIGPNPPRLRIKWGLFLNGEPVASNWWTYGHVPDDPISPLVTELMWPLVRPLDEYEVKWLAEEFI